MLSLASLMEPIEAPVPVLELVSGQPDQPPVDRLLALVTATKQLDVLATSVTLTQREQRSQPDVVHAQGNP